MNSRPLASASGSKITLTSLALTRRSGAYFSSVLPSAKDRLQEPLAFLKSPPTVRFVGNRPSDGPMRFAYCAQRRSHGSAGPAITALRNHQAFRREQVA